MLSFSMTTGAFGKDAEGLPITGLGYDFSEISYTVNLDGEDSFGVSIDGDPGENPWLSVGVDVSGTFDFNVGLRGEVWVDLGHIDTTLDINTDGFTEDHGDKTVTLDTSGFTVDALDIAPVGFDLSESYISLGLGATLDATLSASAYMTYDFGIIGEGAFDFTLLEDQDINVDFTYWMIPDLPQVTFDTVGGLDGNITKFELGDYVEISIDVPEFEYEEAEYTENAASGIDTMHITGMSSPFASIEIGLASFILPPGIGPIGFDMDPLGDLLGEDFEGYLSLALEGGMFDAKLVGTVSIGQEMTITSEVAAEMVTSLGETVSGSLGDAFTFATPEGEGEFTVTASYTLSQTVEAITSIVLNTTLDWRALFLQLEASIDLGFYSDTAEAAFAMWEDSVDLGELLGLTYSFELYNDITTYLSEAGEEEYTIQYENFVTSASGPVLNLTTHQDSVAGGSGNDTITGNARENDLFGFRGDDSILGGGGNDDLIGGRGADVLNGGFGYDFVSYRGSKAGVTVNLSTDVNAGGDAEGDTIASVQGVRGSNLADSLTGDDKNNRLLGWDGDDNLHGEDGDDALVGGAGADLIDGGNGADRISFAPSTAGVTIDLDAGTGLGGDAEGDTYISIENVIGTNNADHITGDEADNVLYGGGGDDSIYGGDGNDIVRGGDGLDALFGGDGIDTMDFRDSNASVSVSFLDANTNSGSTQDNSFDGFENVIGSDFGDIIAGSAFDAVENHFDGGAGADVMYGGGGADTFVMRDNDSVYGGSNDGGFDTIIIDGTSGEYFIQSLANFNWFSITRTVGDYAETFQVANVETAAFSNGDQTLFWTPPFPF